MEEMEEGEEWEEVRNASKISKCTDGCFFEQWAGESRAQETPATS